MKIEKIWLVFIVAIVANGLWAQGTYYQTMPSGHARYKLAAIEMLITPQMRQAATRYSQDVRVQELICMAWALDSFVYDGLGQIRLRGVLMNNGLIDEESIGRTMYYFGMAREQALPWMLASRIMQFMNFAPDGAALGMLEAETTAMASEIFTRLSAYYSQEQVIAFMPHLAYSRGWSPGSMELPPAPPAIMPAIPLQKSWVPARDIVGARGGGR